MRILILQFSKNLYTSSDKLIEKNSILYLISKNYWGLDYFTIIKKKFESTDFCKKGTNMPDITSRPVIDFMWQLTCYNA